MKSLKTVIEDLHKLLVRATQLTAELKHLSTLAVFNVSITAACKTSKGLREQIYQDTMNFERATYFRLPTKAFIGFTRCCAYVLYY